MEIIREKDQGDFRSGRSDFGSRLGSSIDVRTRSAPASFRAAMKPERPRVLIVGLLTQVAVPRFAVGIVIGRNGEMIKKIQNDAGVRIQFKPGQCSQTSCLCSVNIHARTRMPTSLNKKRFNIT